MQKILIGIFILFAWSCNNIETKKVSSDVIVQKELKQIDWNEIEDYPAFPVCEKCTDKVAEKKCFETQLGIYIYASLARHEVFLKDSIKERVWLHLSISANGIPTITSLEQNASVKEQLPNLEQWLDSAVLNLPKIYPARKRGIPVKTNFKLPLVIQSK